MKPLLGELADCFVWLAAIALVAGTASRTAHADPFRLLPDAPQRLYLQGVPHTDRHGVLRLEPDAASFFPRCGFTTLAQELPELRAAGFNCFMPWGGLSLSDDVRDAQSAAMQTIKEYLVGPCNYSQRPDCDSQENSSTQIARIAAEVSAHASDPGVLAWYLEEEVGGCIYPPSNCPERIDNYDRLRAAIKLADPVHPSFNLELSVGASRAPPWLDVLTANGDIVVNDDYPFRHGDETTLEPSIENMARLLRISQQRKPVWLTVQTFEQPSTGGPSWTMPTPVQLRAQVFASIIEGATGILYFASDGWVTRNAQVIGIAPSTPRRYPDDRPGDLEASARQIASSKTLWDAAAKLNAELVRLQAVILAPTSPQPYSVSIAGRAISKTPIRALLKQAEGRYTLLVVNIDDTSLKMRIALPCRAAALTSVGADGDASPVMTRGADFEDSIQGFGVRSYQFDCDRSR